MLWGREDGVSARVAEMQMERSEQSQDSVLAGSVHKVPARLHSWDDPSSIALRGDSDLVKPLPTLQLFQRQILEETLACEQSTLWIQDLVPIDLHAQALFLQKFYQ